jgi:hypothetical protein
MSALNPQMGHQCERRLIGRTFRAHGNDAEMRIRVPGIRSMRSCERFGYLESRNMFPSGNPTRSRQTEAICPSCQRQPRFQVRGTGRAQQKTHHVRRCDMMGFA